MALDMTCTSALTHAKSLGLSWDIGKGYDTFLPLSTFIPRELVKDPHNLELELKVNEVIKQSGNTKDLCFQIPEIIEYLSGIFTLNEGDLVLTGTPLGTANVNHGDILNGKISQEGKVLMTIQANVSLDK